MNTKRYWLRGVLVGFIVTVILYLTMTFFSSRACFASGFSQACLIDWENFFKQTTSFPFKKVNFLLLFLPILFPIPIGAFLGWLYGKIKNRNKSI